MEIDRETPSKHELTLQLKELEVKLIVQLVIKLEVELEL